MRKWRKCLIGGIALLSLRKNSLQKRYNAGRTSSKPRSTVFTHRVIGILDRRRGGSAEPSVLLSGRSPSNLECSCPFASKRRVPRDQRNLQPCLWTKAAKGILRIPISLAAANRVL